MNLLIFFALPLSTILLAIVFQKILKCPIIVAITFFAIYLIGAFGLYGIGVTDNIVGGLIATIIYTLISFITAYIVKLINTVRERFFSSNNNALESNNTNETNTDENYNSCNCSIENNNESLSLNNGVTLSGNILPNQNNGGRTGCVRGYYRRM